MYRYRPLSRHLSTAFTRQTALQARNNVFGMHMSTFPTKVSKRSKSNPILISKTLSVYYISIFYFYPISILTNLSPYLFINFYPVSDAWESILMASCMSFCTKGIHARSYRIHIWYEWILRHRLAAVRRMTTWLEVSRVHFRMKGGFSPVLLEQIFLNCRYLSLHPTKTGVRFCVFVLFSTHSERGFLELPMETTSIHKISIQLQTPENLFWSLPAYHSARRTFMPEVAKSTTDTNGFCVSA